MIAVLLAAGRLWRNAVSRQWQYYVWLIVIARLLLPFGPERSLMGAACQALEEGRITSAVWPVPEGAPVPSLPGAVVEPGGEAPAEPAEEETRPVRAAELPAGRLWLVWLAGALGLLLRKITVYQSFLRYVRAGLTPVSDLAMLDSLSAAAERAGVKRPVELGVNPLVSSPMLIGFFRPCVVLPDADIKERDFQYTVLHELTHYRRRDMLYKWLVQLTVCLHWFNPLVHLMSREIERACEFSCDEAVLLKAGRGGARDYGQTLLDAMAAAGRYGAVPGAASLSGNKKMLKARLDAIMNFQKKSGGNRLLTAALTLCVALGAVFAGARPASASGPQAPGPAAVQRGAGQKRTVSDAASRAERYYEEGSLPLFQIAFSRLDEEARDKWLGRIYAERQIAFWGAAVSRLDEDCGLIQRYAEQTYGDGSTAYFSVLTQHMSGDALEAWLDRALEDGNWTFQSVLFGALDWYDEFDERKEEQDKAWEEARRAEYGAAGVTVDGKNYYYQGQLVNIFLDIRPNKSFYTLEINPKGTVNIKIIRNEENQITDVACLTEAETAALLSDMDGSDEEDWDDEQEDPETAWDSGRAASVPVEIESLEAGARVFLGEYRLSEGDRIRYDVSAERGSRMKIFFAEEGRKDVAYWSADSLWQPGEPLECSADFTVGPPFTEPGTYQLYLQAPDGALENVRGSVSLLKAE